MRTRLRVCAAVLAGLTLAACGAQEAPSVESAKATKNLEVISWWTSGSEDAALQKILDSYEREHGSVKLLDATVSGGSGSAAQVVLAQRLANDDPPDAWQSFAGEGMRQAVSRDRLADVSYLYSGDFADNLPQSLLDTVTVADKQYGVTTGAHRSNVLWFNTRLLKKAGVKPPKAPYSSEQFLDDLAAVDESGDVALCLGGKDGFTAAELAEHILLGTVGSKGWKAIQEDRFDWGGAQARQALKQFDQILDYVDPEAGGLSWDEATAKLGKGKCAFESMNDSAYGELLSEGAKEGRDFGYVAFPGTDGDFLAVLDTFVAARDATNLRNAGDFLAVISQPETMAAFNKEKGSVPTRTDVDLASFPAYQRQSGKVLREGDLLLSITHGEAMSPQFQDGFYDAAEAFVENRDPDEFETILRDSMTDARRVTP